MVEWFRMAIVYLLQATMLVAIWDEWVIAWGVLSLLWGTVIGIVRSMTNDPDIDNVRLVPEEVPKRQHIHELPKAA